MGRPWWRVLLPGESPKNNFSRSLLSSLFAFYWFEKRDLSSVPSSTPRCTLIYLITSGQVWLPFTCGRRRYADYPVGLRRFWGRASRNLRRRWQFGKRWHRKALIISLYVQKLCIFSICCTRASIISMLVERRRNYWMVRRWLFRWWQRHHKCWCRLDYDGGEK